MWCSLFLFLTGNKFSGEIWSENENCQFELKIGTQTTSNMKNSIVMFIFHVFDWKYHFFGNLFPNINFFVGAAIRAYNYSQNIWD